LHSEWDQSALVLCLMYPLFEVSFFPKDRGCKTKVYIFLPLWQQLLLHNVLIPLSGESRKTCLNHVALSIQGQQPVLDVWWSQPEVRGERRESEGPVRFVWYQSKKGWWASCGYGDQPCPDGQHTPGKVSPSDSDWQGEEAVLLPCWMASPHNTRGVIRSCQSNMRELTMTSLTAKEWPTLLMCIHWETRERQPLQSTVSVYASKCSVVRGCLCGWKCLSLFKSHLNTECFYFYKC